MKKPKKPSGAGAKKPAPQSGKAPGRGKGAGRKKAAGPKPQHHHHLQTVKQARQALHRAQARARRAAHAKHHPVRQLALGEGVACCAAEALAASLRLAGVPVGHEDVLALYWRTAGDADAGATLSATLAAATRFGLAGVRPRSFGPCETAPDFMPAIMPGLILGVTLPGGPHALTLDPSGAAWSWGELYELPQLGPGRIDEAWLVDWEA